jgi:G3E family GTPase
VTISNVPTTLFTGFFGVGKTTAIKSVLSRKPQHENWAILVNEFGEVAVDHTAFEQDSINNVTIKEIPGGCMCCSTNVPMRVAITEILRRSRPDRLLIEPTGIGHPARMLDELRCADLREIINVGAVICFVDPRFIGDPRIENVEVFRDQVHLADILIAGKVDLASAEDLNRYQVWAEALFPPKLIISQAEMGEIDIAILDFKGSEKRMPLFPSLHDHEQRVVPNNIGAPKPKIPVIAKNSGVGYQGIGWIFADEDIFDQEKLFNYLRQSGAKGLGSVVRLKGVFRIGANWILIDRVQNELSFGPISYRRDSRLEIIWRKDAVVDPISIQNSLIQCVK